MQAQQVNDRSEVTNKQKDRRKEAKKKEIRGIHPKAVEGDYSL